MNPTSAGPIGWFLRLLGLIYRFLYYVIRLVLWILRRLRPRR